MSCHSGPNLVEDGLVLRVDTSNSKSYNPNLVTTLGAFNYSFNNQISETSLDVAPDGSLVLCKHDLTGATSPFMNVRVNRTISVGTYTISAWVKGTTSFSGAFAYIGETPGNSGASPTTINVTTSWQRFSHTFSVTTEQTNGRVQIFFSTQGNDKIISVWGVEIISGSSPTKQYINSNIRGDIWYDLSGHGNNGSLTNGPTFDSSNGGSIVFDGVNDYISFGNLGIDFYSISIWGYIDTEITPLSAHMGLCKLNTASQAGLSFGAVTGFITGETLTFLYYDNVTYTRTAITDNISAGWHNFCVNWNLTTYDIYLDGKIKTTTSGTVNHVPLITLNDVNLAQSYGGGTSNIFSGKISSTTIYNRSLSSDEIRQNFNATRGRYGI